MADRAATPSFVLLFALVGVNAAALVFLAVFRKLACLESDSWINQATTGTLLV